MKLTVSTNFADVAAKVRDIGKQAEFAAAVALTKTADDAKSAIRTEMSKSLDRPTSYTLNSVFIKPATPAKLEAFVWLKDKRATAKGNAADDYLRPEIFGGSRGRKGFENALQRIGVLGVGMMVVPGSGCKLDAFGNISRGQIVEILAYFGALQDTRSNSTAETRAKKKKGTKTKRGIEYFVSYGKGSARGNRVQRLHAGVYSKTGTSFGKAIKPVLIFVKRASYKKQFAFFEAGDRAAKNLPGRFDEEMVKALKTARF
jgi:hypothetical protein